jgi:predicted enzyme related to lactoylglutathione lyase
VTHLHPVTTGPTPIEGHLRMPPSIHPLVVTRDLDRLLGFYAGLLGAVEVTRHPPEGPTFFVVLRIGDNNLGLVSDTDAAVGTPQRMLLSAEVADVDASLLEVEGLGGHVLGPPNDMPWGERVAHIKDPDSNTVNLTQPIAPS